MVKIQKISEIEPRLGFTEFDMLKKYRQSFATSELGRLHALFPFSELARQMHLKSSALGRKSYFSPEGKIALMVLKSYTNFSDAQLIEHLNGNIHYQLFCGVQIDPLHPLTNPKIVSAIRHKVPQGPPSFLRRARARMAFTVGSFRMPMASMLRRSRDSENPPEAVLSFGASSC